MKNVNLVMAKEKINAQSVLIITNLETISKMIKNVMKNVHLIIIMIQIIITNAQATILVQVG